MQDPHPHPHHHQQQQHDHDFQNALNRKDWSKVVELFLVSREEDKSMVEEEIQRTSSSETATTTASDNDTTTIIATNYKEEDDEQHEEKKSNETTIVTVQEETTAKGTVEKRRNEFSSLEQWRRKNKNHVASCSGSSGGSGTKSPMKKRKASPTSYWEDAPIHPMGRNNSCFSGGCLPLSNCWNTTKLGSGLIPSTKAATSNDTTTATATTTTTTTISKTVVDELAKDLATLRMEDKQSIVEEIHGATVLVNENPHFIIQLLIQMEHEIQRIPQKVAYHRAVTLSPSFVQDPTFCVMFLRADHYNPQQAAQRIIKYFQVKEVLFGPSKLVDKITINDILVDDDCRNMFTSGCTFMIPQKDRIGRGIIMGCLDQLDPNIHPMTLARLHWYFSMVAAEDHSVQLRGLVSIVYNLPKQFLMKNTFHVFETTSLLEGFPVRYTSIHWCLTNRKLVFAGALFNTIHRHIRLRTQFHEGSHLECQYKLGQHGVPTQDFPIHLNGEINQDVIRQFIKSRHMKELQQQTQFHLLSVQQLPYSDSPNGPNVTVIDKPNDDDVLAGMSGKCFHPGNLRYQKLIDEHTTKYNLSSYQERTKINISIVRTVKESHNGRFLKKMKDGSSVNGWVVMPDDEAHKKVAHAFRHRRERKSNQGGDTKPSLPGCAKCELAGESNRTKKMKTI